MNTSHHLPVRHDTATVHIRPGLENASIIGRSGTPGLVHVDAARHRPDLRRRGGQPPGVTVRYPRVTFSRTAPSQLVLDTGPCWEIAVAGGMSRCELHLDTLEVGALRVSGGIADTRIDLPRPRTTVPIDLGDCADVTIRLADDTTARVEIERGAHALEIGDRHVGACRGPAVFDIGDPDASTECYTIRLRSAHRTTIGHGRGDGRDDGRSRDEGVQPC